MNESINNITVQPDCSDSPEWFYNTIFFIIFLIIGIPGNILVLLTVAARKKRTGNDLFIANIAVADLLVLVLYYPIRFDSYINCIHTASAIFCHFIWPLTQLMFFVSIFTMAAMTIHRYRHVVNPFLPPEEKHKIYISIGVIWLLSLGPGLPLFVVMKWDPMKQTCKEDFSLTARHAYTILVFTVQLIIPLFIISGAYFMIWRDLSKSTAFRASIKSNGQVTTNNSRENRQVTRTIVTIVTLFVVCMLPNHIAWMLWDFGNSSDKKAAITIFTFSGLLALFACCVNPIVYGSLTKHFRRGYYRLICYPCSKDKRFWLSSQSRSPRSSDIKENVFRNVFNSHNLDTNSIKLTPIFNRGDSLLRPMIAADDGSDVTIKTDDNKNVEESEEELRCSESKTDRS